MTDEKTKYYKVNFDIDTEWFGIHPCDDRGYPLPNITIDSLLAAGQGTRNMFKAREKLEAEGYEPSPI